MLLGAGANVKAVSERPGHASTSFTMDVYASSMPALEEAAAEQVAALIRGHDPARVCNRFAIGV